MDAFLSGMNPVQQGAVYVTLSLIVLCTIVLPGYMFVVIPSVNFVRVRMGLEPIGDSRTLTQIQNSELFQQDAADRRAAKAKAAKEQAADADTLAA